jgi:hypothetical protein
MGYEYIEEQLELKYKGEVYPFRPASAYEQRALNNKFKEADENTDAVDLYINFFKELGLPEEVLSKMSLKGLLGLFDYTIGTKKN